MRLWLTRLWTLFKWLVVLFGVVVTYKLVATTTRQEFYFFSSGRNCDFSVFVPDQEWSIAPSSAPYAFTPVLIPRSADAGNPKLFLTLHRTYLSQDPGGSSHNTTQKCLVEKKGAVRTEDGSDAQVFLSSNCEVRAPAQRGRVESPFREHILYGYIPYKDRLADFITLSSSDKSLLLENEEMMISALKSYSTNRSSCVSRRNSIKKFQLPQ